jgi:pimeloyl-ACP methyl ester carboxylesterase
MAEQTARMIPNAELVLVPDAAHLVMVEQPDQTTAALRRFLAQFK